VVGDFRLLNQQTVPDKYAIPLLTDFIGELTMATVFSTLDLFKSYHQIKIAPADVQKTAMISPLENFAYKRMPMGLKNAGATFQRSLNEILRETENCVFVTLTMF